MRLLPLVVAVVFAVGCSSAPVPADGGSAGGAGGAGGGSAGGAGGGSAGGAGGGSAGGAGGGSAGGAGGGSAGGAGGGSGGGAADAGTSCNELSASYSKEFPVTKECNPASLVNECTVSREKLLGCGCHSFVNANGVSTLDVIAAQWKAKSCAAPVCPAAVCPAATGGSCMQQDASIAGLCQDTF